MKRKALDVAAFLDRPSAIVGTTGAGKTFAAKGAVEHLLAAGSRVIIIDPTGVWYGLRAGRDGSVSGGFPVLIFGGENADIQITPDSGEHLAQALGERDVQAIIDVSEMTGYEKRRFLTPFLERLYATNKAALHLVVDEADEIAPQNPMPDERALSGAFDKIVRRGRVKGFRPLMITQRPAVLHKNVLSQIATLIALKLTSPQDRKAIEGWVKGNADAEQAQAVMQSLTTLKQGEGWVWSPGHGVLERMRFPAIRTFDSSRTPVSGERAVAPALSAVDVEELRIAMASLSEKADDAPAKRVKPASTADLAAAEKRGYEADYDRGYGEGMAAGWQKAVEQVAASLAALVPPSAATGSPSAQVAKPATIERSRASAERPVKPRKPAPVAVPTANGHDKEGVSGPQQTVLNALAWWEAAGHVEPTRAMLAAVCGWNVRSGHLKNVLGQCRSSGLVDYPRQGSVSLTDAGRALAQAPEGSLNDRIVGVMTGPQRSVYVALRENGASSRQRLAEMLGWNASSGHLKNVLGRMRSMDIVHYPANGTVDLADWVRQSL